jgi:hypothetical protein
VLAAKRDRTQAPLVRGNRGSECRKAAGRLGPLRVVTCRMQPSLEIGPRIGAVGQTSVSDDTEMASVKRPFAASGKLALGIARIREYTGSAIMKGHAGRAFSRRFGRIANS